MKINKVEGRKRLEVMKEEKLGLFCGNVEIPKRDSVYVRMAVFKLGAGHVKIIQSQNSWVVTPVHLCADQQKVLRWGVPDFLPPQMAAWEHPVMHMALPDPEQGAPLVVLTACPQVGTSSALATYL